MNNDDAYQVTLALLLKCLGELKTDRVQSVKGQLSETEYLNLYYFEGKLIFSIEDLYQYLEFKPTLSYNQFRKMLYNSTLNQDLLAYRGKVTNYLIGTEQKPHLFSLITV